MAQREIKGFKGLWAQLWSTFRKGTFTKRPPEEEGLYPVWGRDGVFRGYVDVFEAGGELWYANRSGAPSVSLSRCGFTSNNPRKVHVGWWWTRPVPSMPAGPDWDEVAGETTKLSEVSG